MHRYQSATKQGECGYDLEINVKLCLNTFVSNKILVKFFQALI